MPPEKVGPLRTIAATTAVLKWSGSLHSKGNPPRDWSQGLEEPTLEGCDRRPDLKWAEPSLIQ
jgi:hypothetical protein